MKDYYIYKIICLCDEWNGKFYIGKHYGDINDCYTGSGRLIKEYFDTHEKIKGLTYDKEVLEVGDENSICDLEREYIREGIKSELCLNLSCSSGKGHLGHKHSEETKQKMRKPKSEETKQKMRKPLSEETKQKMSKSLKGRVPWNKGKIGCYSNEYKRKLSEAAKRQWARN